jgi:alpha-L-arabinofuranosidase
MTKAHLSQTSIAVAAEKPEPVGLSVSASRRGGELTLTLVNPKPDAGMTANCSLAGASARSATARILHHPDLNAANTFATPDRIAPRDHQIAVGGGTDDRFMSSVGMGLRPAKVHEKRASWQ